MKSARPLLAALLLCSTQAFAETGVLKSWDGKANYGVVIPDNGGKEEPCHLFGADPAKMKAGAHVEFQNQWIFGVKQVMVTKVFDLNAPKPAPAPPAAPAPAAPAPANAALKGTVKTYDANARLGTLAPADGGKDLVFAVDPKAPGSVKVGGKVSYVQVMVTAGE